MQEMTFGSGSAALTPIRIELNAGQSANALTIVDSTGTVLNGFDNVGNLLGGAVNVASLEYEFIMGAY
jgi:hypothetical protein